MGLRRRDIASLALVAVSAFWGAAAWWGGSVTLGVNLTYGGDQVRLGYITPESIAWSEGFWPGAIVVGLELRDGTMVVGPDAPADHLLRAEMIQATLMDRRISSIEAIVGPTQDVDLSGGTVSVNRSTWEARLSGAGWLMLVGALLGIGVSLLVSHRVLGATWVGAAIPIGSAIAIPLLALPIQYSGTGYGIAFGSYLLPALGAVPVAHALAERRAPGLPRLVVLGTVVAILALLTAWTAARFSGNWNYLDDRLLRYLLVAAITLVPAGLAALDTARSTLERMEILAVGMTPAVAMTVLPRAYADLWPLLGWLALVVVWRRFSIAPLLGLAERTQRQRDLAVAAAEAERARLASDLHDDALQELTQIMRRFDEAGDALGADMARGVAERLRAICSDLRLPLLKTMGAGAALEWLVERVQPMVDGAVALDRHDQSRPPEPVELAVFRVAQEALANAVRHGRAPISVLYRADANEVSLTVTDKGSGIPHGAAEAALAAGHFGLAAMQQRAEQVGAVLDIRSWPGDGTVVALNWRAS